MSKKDKNCKTCSTMRCCPNHCCDWDDCKCGDCELCGGELILNYTPQELIDIAAAAKKEEELAKQKKAEEEKAKKAKETPPPKTKDELDLEKLLSEVKEMQEEEDKIFKQKTEAQKAQDEEHRKVLDMVAKSQKETEATLARLNETLKSLSNTRSDVKDTMDMYNNMHANFNNAFRDSLQNILTGFGEIMKNLPTQEQLENNEVTMPEISDITTTAELIAKTTEIAILTGSGISTASGIPTFRGEGGFWVTHNESEKVKAQELLTSKYFLEHPKEVWKWCHQFKSKVFNSETNVSHNAISNFQVFCKENETANIALITQNIDNYHVDAFYRTSSTSKKSYMEESKEVQVTNEDDASYGYCTDVLEIHGNIKYMRCQNNCVTQLFPSPNVGCPEDLVPECPKCKRLARPHVLFFDETYDEKFYKSETVMNRIAVMDCLIVIGTTLETSLASRIVERAVSSDILIVEINPEPCIQVGNVKQLVGKAEEIVPELIKEIKKAMKESKA